MGLGPETRLVNLIRDRIREEHPTAWVLKTHGNPYQSAGLPDLFVVVGGRFVGIEVKAQRPGESREHALGRVTPQQAAVIAALQRAGATAGPALNIEDALGLIAHALGDAPSSSAELSHSDLREYGGDHKQGR